MTTRIEWTDETWNPVTGCAKVSAGCKHCYAERMANRLAGRYGYPEKPDQFKVTLHPDKLDDPLKWRKPRRVFVNSMSDLFHKDVPDEFILEVWAIMHRSPKHTFQILTKRPKRMCEFITEQVKSGWIKVLPNVWLGISCENQATADERIPWLLKTPAAVRFVSYEPALGPVDFWQATGHILDKNTGIRPPSRFSWFKERELNWIIAGGESGPGARPAHPDWFRSARDQCQAAGVPFFLKQMVVNGKMVKMPELDGRVWNEYPEAAR